LKGAGDVSFNKMLAKIAFKTKMLKIVLNCIFMINLNIPPTPFKGGFDKTYNGFHVIRPTLNLHYSLVLIFIVGLIVFFTNSCGRMSPETVTDIDGNIYHTVTIGNQVWMTENLKVTRYRNGDLIPNVSDTSQWRNLPVGIYCNYENNPKNGLIYGRLYNWYAATDVRNIAPKGWHVPGIEEIETLVTYLGGDTIAAGKMKESGTTHWLYPNTGATVKSGFLALPGGYRFNHNGTFHTLGSNGYWWTSTQSYEMYAWSARLYSYFAYTTNVHDFKTLGLSIRCVKD
jgi:uncharacterized protein (TIGR02145 family)